MDKFTYNSELIKSILYEKIYARFFIKIYDINDLKYMIKTISEISSNCEEIESYFGINRETDNDGICIETLDDYFKKNKKIIEPDDYPYYYIMDIFKDGYKNPSYETEIFSCFDANKDFYFKGLH